MGDAADAGPASSTQNGHTAKASGHVSSTTNGHRAKASAQANGRWRPSEQAPVRRQVPTTFASGDPVIVELGNTDPIIADCLRDEKKLRKKLREIADLETRKHVEATQQQKIDSRDTILD